MTLNRIDAARQKATNKGGRSTAEYGKHAEAGPSSVRLRAFCGYARSHNAWRTPH